MEKNKGVTLVILVITIIVILIIAGVSIGIGSFSINLYQDSILDSEAKELQTVIINQYQRYLSVNDESILIGTPCDSTGDTNASVKEYYLLKNEDLINLGMKNPKDEYIVNYKTGEIINKTSVNSKGEQIHLTTKI